MWEQPAAEHAGFGTRPQASARRPDLVRPGRRRLAAGTKLSHGSPRRGRRSVGRNPLRRRPAAIEPQLVILAGSEQVWGGRVRNRGTTFAGKWRGTRARERNVTHRTPRRSSTGHHSAASARPMDEFGLLRTAQQLSSILEGNAPNADKVARRQVQVAVRPPLPARGDKFAACNAPHWQE
jgi:hypothetical protein